MKLRHGPNGQEFFPEQIQSEYVRRPQLVVSYLSMMVEITPPPVQKKDAEDSCLVTIRVARGLHG
jgi:hypothetical protein